ncbi:Peroxisomal membrane protein PEX14 [Blattella germanica]|nr:Peroxisomal membrane protein PEX14 [Blattella germanica]
MLQQFSITTAVTFLLHPTVQKSSLANRQAFLKKKGLTDDEVLIACELAGPFQSPYNGQLQTMLQSPAVPVSFYLQNVVPATLWSATKRILIKVAIIGGISFGVYMLYKKYVERYLLGIERKQKALEDSLAEVNNTLKGISKELDRITEQQRQQSEEATNQIQDLKTEITTIKGDFLSRHQFAAATGIALVPPFAYQLSSQQMGDEEQE